MRVRSLLWLTWALTMWLLVGCGSPGDGGRQQGERERRVLGQGSDEDHDPRSREPDVPLGLSPRTDGPEDRPPALNEGGSPLDLPRSDGQLRSVHVTLELDAPDRPDTAAIVLLGFRGVDVTAKGALKPGRRPQWYWASPPMPIDGNRLSVQAPLTSGLAMFALLDVNGDQIPGRGEYMSAIQKDFVPPAEGGVAIFPLDRRFGTE